MKLIKAIIITVLLLLLFNIVSCNLFENRETELYDMVKCFFEALMNNKMDEASSYLALAALNSKEENNKTIYDLLTFIGNGITGYTIERGDVSERTGDIRFYNISYFYLLETEYDTFQGNIKTCLYDNKNPDNVGIYYIEIYNKKYYDWYVENDMSFYRMYLPGIYIYNEQNRPYPSVENSIDSFIEMQRFMAALQEKDRNEAYSCISVSASNSNEKNNKSIDELLDYLEGKVIKTDFTKVDIHIESKSDGIACFVTYLYFVETEYKSYKGYLNICEYDAENPDNIGIMYVELAYEDYYKWYLINQVHYYPPDIFGIFIYDELNHPNPYVN